VCSLAIWIPGPIPFPCTCTFTLAHSSRQINIVYAEQLPFLPTSYNIPRRCFAVMTSQPANYLMSVIWSCCQHCNLYLLWILEWLHIGFSSSSLVIDSKHCIYSQRVSELIFLRLLLSLNHPIALHAYNHHRINANLTCYNVGSFCTNGKQHCFF